MSEMKKRRRGNQSSRRAIKAAIGYPQ